MMKRPFWFGTGLAAGVAGTLWAEQRIRRQMARLTPNYVANQAVRQIGDRVRSAVDAGRQERDRREAELWAELDRRTGVPTAVPTPGPERPAPRGRHGARRVRH
ncbi:MAG TPA: hypothetical protein VHX40_08070 [Acidimicrobiales bacterium]|nr:hypothetical protein [Acidimicrobiales bacterium]